GINGYASRPGARQGGHQTHGIGVRRLRRDGQVSAGDTAIVCTVGDRHRSRVRLVHLERPIFGGVRSYFLCPTCDRHCDLLYSRQHTACRKCHRLAYASEKEPRSARRLRQMFKRRERLGQMEGGIVAAFPAKPKWWRWPKYLRIWQQGVRREREHWRPRQ